MPSSSPPCRASVSPSVASSRVSPGSSRQDRVPYSALRWMPSGRPELVSVCALPSLPQHEGRVRARMGEHGLAGARVHQSQGRHDEPGAGLRPEVVELAQEVVEPHQRPGGVGVFEKKRAQGVLDLRRPRGGLQPLAGHVADHQRHLIAPTAKAS